MAKMNLLKANFTGRIGQVVGQKWKNVSQIHARILGKKPPNATQTANVRAFEKLNRFCGGFLAYNRDIFDLRSKKMLPHNVLAQKMKRCVENKVFEPEFIADFFDAPNFLRMSNFEYFRDRGDFEIGIIVTGTVPPEMAGEMVTMIIRDDGVILFYARNPIRNIGIRGSLDMVGTHSIFPFCFIAGKVEGKFIKHSFNTVGEIGTRYSYSEQQSPDTWIDGRPIFNRTFATTAFPPTSGGEAQEYFGGIGDIRIIRHEGFFTTSKDGYNQIAARAITQNTPDATGYFALYEQTSDGLFIGAKWGGDAPFQDGGENCMCLINLWYIYGDL